MEKICEYDESYSRTEASEQGFCSDCNHRNCPYYEGSSNRRQKKSWTRETTNIWEAPRKKEKPKKKFVKKSDYDDDDY